MNTKPVYIGQYSKKHALSLAKECAVDHTVSRWVAGTLGIEFNDATAPNEFATFMVKRLDGETQIEATHTILVSNPALGIHIPGDSISADLRRYQEEWPDVITVASGCHKAGNGLHYQRVLEQFDLDEEDVMVEVLEDPVKKARAATRRDFFLKNYV